MAKPPSHPSGRQQAFSMQDYRTILLDTFPYRCMPVHCLSAGTRAWGIGSMFIRKACGALAEQLGGDGDEQGAHAHSQGEEPLLPDLRAHLEELPDLRHAHDDHLAAPHCFSLESITSALKQCHCT